MPQSDGQESQKAATRLLVVDDDRLVVATLAQGLGNAGYAVVTAESAEDAENWLAGNERPDLAIIDVRMPGQGGLHLAQRLKELDRIPFVILSAYSDTDIVDEANRCGAMGYAVKPLDIPQLVPIIEAALARAREMQDLRQVQFQLQQALDNERDISVAIGIVMANDQLLRRDAFNTLRNNSRTQRRKMAMVASEVIRKHEQHVSSRRRPS